MNTPLQLAISPCPNDTFLFAALLHGQVDTEGLRFEAQFADIQALNQTAQAAAADVVKISYATYPLVQHAYTLLDAGSALGRGCGPLVVARQAMPPDALAQARIAIPGWNTTAHLLLQFFAPQAPVANRSVRLFHEIMPLVADGTFDAGLIIHESRFTYPQYGLVCVQDLGAYWEAQTGQPIPLGGIVAKRSLGVDAAVLSRVIRRSAEFAFANPQAVMPFVRAHAQEMDDTVMQAHIDLYVNQYSLDLGAEGHAAVTRLLQVAAGMPALQPQA